jgi:autotransporter-associated beta strand protein
MAMRRGRRMTIWFAAGLLVAFPAIATGITLNQVDMFQGSTDSWTDGHGGGNLLVIGTGGPDGAGDSYLQVSSGSFGGSTRMITFNKSQWTGDYITAGVSTISMSLKNFGTATLPIRITIRDATGGQIIPGYSSTNAFMLPADGQWHKAQFLLDSADMTAVGTGLPPLSTELTAVEDFRLLSATQPSIIGDAISAQIGVDDITALPRPPTVWTGASSTNWSDAGNWTGVVPGVTTGATNADTATFNQSAVNSPLTIDAGRNLENLTFDTASVSSLTVGAVAGNALLLTSGGVIQATSTMVNAQTINAPLVLEGGYSFTSGAASASATLKFGGGIAPAATTGVTTLTLNGANTGANTINGILADHSSGLLAVAKSGSGQWILSGANTYSGGTTISAGTLQLSGSGTLGNVSGSLNVAGGALDLNNTSQGVGELTSTGAGGTIVNNGTGVSTLTVGNGNATGGNFNGVIADNNNAAGGAVAVTKTGFGTITLSGANTYTGPTNVNTGTLAVAAPGSLGNTAITVSATASFSARPGTGTLSIGSTSDPSAGATITLNLGAGAVNGGTFDMLDGAIGTVMLNQGANVATGMTLGTSGPLNSPVLAFEIGDNGTATAADHLFVTNGVVVGIGTGAEISITPIGSSPLHAGTYPLITAGSFTNADRFSLATPAIVIGSNQYNLSLSNTGTVENLIISLGGPPVAYWSGKQNSVWNALTPAPGGTNWLNAPSGTDAGALPSSGTNVYFTANTAANLTTTLGQDFAINSLTFTGTGTSATNGVKISGNTLTISASDANGNPAGSGIVVESGSGAHTIASAIVLAASQIWTNNSTNPLTVSGNLGDGGHGFSLTVIGPGLIVLGGTATYGGTTTVADGTLATTSTGTIGTGPLTVSSTGAPSVVSLGSTQSIGALSGTVSGGGSARVNVDPGVALTVAQSADAIFAGAVNLASTANLRKLGGNRLEVDGGTSLGDASSISVVEGTLRLAPTNASPSIGNGVIASITGSATLELAGSLSSLGTNITGNRANIQNNSSAAAGLLVSGTSQQVGNIDGSGTTQVNAGSDLTANHIIQGALVIGGTSKSPALVTIDASDASGNPLAGLAALAAPTPLLPSIAGGNLADSLGSTTKSDPLADSLPLVLSLTGAPAAVPEPSSLFLLAVGGLLLARAIFRRSTILNWKNREPRT